MFVHLQVQSHYSFLESIIKIPVLLKAVQGYGMDAVGITDMNGLYGALEFVDYAKKNSITSIVGVQLGRCLDKQALIYSKKTSLPTMTLFAKNLQGLKTLMKLVSQAHSQQIHSIPRIGLDDIQNNHDDLLVSLGGIGSRVQHYLGENNEPLVSSTITQLKSIVGIENLLGQIIAQSYDLIPRLPTHNEYIRTLGNNYGVRLYAGSTVLYISPQDVEAYEMSLCIKDGLKRTDPQRRTIGYDASFRNEDQIRGILLGQGYNSSVFIDDLMEMTETIAKECSLSVPGGQVYFPNYYSAQRIQDLYVEHKGDFVV